MAKTAKKPSKPPRVAHLNIRPKTVYLGSVNTADELG